MIGMGLYQLLRRIGLKIKTSAILASIVIFLYGIMTGFAVSAIRAIAMFLLQMLAQILGRTYDRITALAVAAVLVLVEQPLYLFHSGFQFSFLCVLGISLILPVLGNVRKGKKLLEGIAMMAVTLPVYLGVFYQIPVYSMFLNFIVLPMMSVLMGAGIVMILAAFVWTGLGLPAAWLITGILMVYEKLALFTERLPYHYWTPGCPAKWQMAVYVAVLIVVAALGRTKRKAVLYQKDCIHRRGDCAKGILQEDLPYYGGKWILTYGIPVGICWGLILLGAVILTWRFRPELQVTFLDVGQGDCIFLQTEDGTSYLTDGGSSSVSRVGKYRMIPFLKYQGSSRVKAVFVSHADSDHCNGIAELLEQAELEGITVENLVLPDLADECRNEGYEELVDLAGQNGITVQFLHEGQQFQDGELLFQCLHPSKGYRAEDLNETSMVLLVTYKEFSLLLTGDVQGAGEEHLTQELQDRKEPGVTDHAETELTILKVAHHGSKNSTSEEFLKAANPTLAIISCGEGNRYGHPHEETLERLEKADVPWFCTKDYGAITVTVDGESRLKVRGYMCKN